MEGVNHILSILNMNNPKSKAQILPKLLEQKPSKKLVKKTPPEQKMSWSLQPIGPEF
jgi:hypothetical protein